jgi:3-hydroxyisobutyrate dehydrogenase-like beta-hydroxyacid dehydrogenase
MKRKEAALVAQHFSTTVYNVESRERGSSSKQQAHLLNCSTIEENAKIKIKKWLANKRVISTR